MAASGRPYKPGPSKRRSLLDGAPPIYREKFAQWIEAKVREFPRLIAQSQEWLRTHPDDSAEREQLRYYLNALGFARYLAYHLRTEKVRGVEDKANPQKETQE